jgi:hypothetical protein
MENITVTSVMPETVSVALINLIDARGLLVKNSSKTGEVIRAYARCLQVAFGNEWYLLTGKEKAGVKSERGMFKAAMIEAGQAKNVDVYWQRTKEESGYVTAGNKVSATVSPDDKNMMELKIIINRIFKSEENGEMIASSDYKGALMDVFEALGGNVMDLGKK